MRLEKETFISPSNGQGLIRHLYSRLVFSNISELAYEDYKIRYSQSGNLTIHFKDNLFFKMLITGEIYFTLLGNNNAGVRRVLRYLGVPIISFKNKPSVLNKYVSVDGIYLINNDCTEIYPVAEWEEPLSSFFGAKSPSININ